MLAGNDQWLCVRVGLIPTDGFACKSYDFDNYD